jgi:hypothetical protein
MRNACQINFQCLLMFMTRPQNVIMALNMEVQEMGDDFKALLDGIVAEKKKVLTPPPPPPPSPSPLANAATTRSRRSTFSSRRTWRKRTSLATTRRRGSGLLSPLFSLFLLFPLVSTDVSSLSPYPAPTVRSPLTDHPYTSRPPSLAALRRTPRFCGWTQPTRRRWIACWCVLNLSPPRFLYPRPFLIQPPTSSSFTHTLPSLNPSTCPTNLLAFISSLTTCLGQPEGRRRHHRSHGRVEEGQVHGSTLSPILPLVVCIARALLPCLLLVTTLLRALS